VHRKVEDEVNATTCISFGNNMNSNNQRKVAKDMVSFVQGDCVLTIGNAKGIIA